MVQHKVRDRRSARRRLHDMKTTAKIVVDPTDKSPRGKRLLREWRKDPSLLDVKGVDDKAAGLRAIRHLDGKSEPTNGRKRRAERRREERETEAKRRREERAAEERAAEQRRREGRESAERLRRREERASEAAHREAERRHEREIKAQEEREDRREAAAKKRREARERKKREAEKIEDRRSKKRRAHDNAVRAKRVVAPDDEKGVEAWRKNPNRIDIEGVDTPSGESAPAKDVHPSDTRSAHAKAVDRGIEAKERVSPTDREGVERWRGARNRSDVEGVDTKGAKRKREEPKAKADRREEKRAAEEKAADERAAEERRREGREAAENLRRREARASEASRREAERREERERRREDEAAEKREAEARKRADRAVEKRRDEQIEREQKEDRERDERRRDQFEDGRKRAREASASWRKSRREAEKARREERQEEDYPIAPPPVEEPSPAVEEVVEKVEEALEEPAEAVEEALEEAGVEVDESEVAFQEELARALAAPLTDEDKEILRKRMGQYWGAGQDLSRKNLASPLTVSFEFRDARAWHQYPIFVDTYKWLRHQGWSPSEAVGQAHAASEEHVAPLDELSESEQRAFVQEWYETRFYPERWNVKGGGTLESQVGLGHLDFVDAEAAQEAAVIEDEAEVHELAEAVEDVAEAVEELAEEMDDPEVVRAAEAAARAAEEVQRDTDDSAALVPAEAYEESLQAQTRYEKALDEFDKSPTPENRREVIISGRWLASTKGISESDARELGELITDFEERFPGEPVETDRDPFSPEFRRRAKKHVEEMAARESGERGAITEEQKERLRDLADELNISPPHGPRRRDKLHIHALAASGVGGYSPGFASIADYADAEKAIRVLESLAATTEDEGAPMSEDVIAPPEEAVRAATPMGTEDRSDREEFDQTAYYDKFHEASMGGFLQEPKVSKRDLKKMRKGDDLYDAFKGIVDSRRDRASHAAYWAARAEGKDGLEAHHIANDAADEVRNELESMKRRAYTASEKKTDAARVNDGLRGALGWALHGDLPPDIYAEIVEFRGGFQGQDIIRMNLLTGKKDVTSTRSAWPGDVKDTLEVVKYTTEKPPKRSIAVNGEEVVVGDHDVKLRERKTRSRRQRERKTMRER